MARHVLSSCCDWVLNDNFWSFGFTCSFLGKCICEVWWWFVTLPWHALTLTTVPTIGSARLGLEFSQQLAWFFTQLGLDFFLEMTWATLGQALARLLSLCLVDRMLILQLLRGLRIAGKSGSARLGISEGRRPWWVHHLDGIMVVTHGVGAGVVDLLMSCLESQPYQLSSPWVGCWLGAVWVSQFSLLVFSRGIVVKTGQPLSRARKAAVGLLWRFACVFF